jgi:hypothetical protein
MPLLAGVAVKKKEKREMKQRNKKYMLMFPSEMRIDFVRSDFLTLNAVGICVLSFLRPNTL